MKKMISMMLCLVLILSLVACGNDPTGATETPTTQTTAPTETTPTVDNLPTVYTEAIQTLSQTLAPEDVDMLKTLLFDVDNNGVEELLLMYPSQEDGKNIFACDLYTMEENTLITLLQNHRVFYNIAGGQTGSVGAALLDGNPYFYVTWEYGDHMGYGEESLHQHIGGWNLYSLVGTELSLETTIAYDLLENNGNVEGEDFTISGKPADYTFEALADLSTVTRNDEPMSVEEYSNWLAGMTIQADIFDAEDA